MPFLSLERIQILRCIDTEHSRDEPCESKSREHDGHTEQAVEDVPLGGSPHFLIPSLRNEAHQSPEKDQEGDGEERHDERIEYLLADCADKTVHRGLDLRNVSGVELVVEIEGIVQDVDDTDS